MLSPQRPCAGFCSPKAQCCLRNYTSDHNSEKREKGEGNRAGKFPVCCLQFCYLTLNCHFFTKRLLNLLVTAPTRCSKMCWVSVKRDLVTHHISASAVICAVAIIKSQMHLWFSVAIPMTTNKKLQCRKYQGYGHKHCAKIQLPSECHSRNGNSSEQVTFSNFLLSNFAEPVWAVASVSCSYQAGEAASVVFCSPSCSLFFRPFLVNQWDASVWNHSTP